MCIYIRIYVSRLIIIIFLQLNIIYPTTLICSWKTNFSMDVGWWNLLVCGLAKCPNIFLLRSAASARYFFRSDLGHWGSMGSMDDDDDDDDDDDEVWYALKKRKLKQRKLTAWILNPCRKYINLYQCQIDTSESNYIKMTWNHIGLFLQTYQQTTYSSVLSNSPGTNKHHGTLGHHSWTPLGHQRLHRSFPLNFLLISNSIINLFSNSEYFTPKNQNTWSNKASLIHSLKRNSSPLKTDRDPNENVILQPLIFKGCWFQGEYYPNNPYMAYVPTFTIKIYINQPNVMRQIYQS